MGTACTKNDGLKGREPSRHISAGFKFERIPSAGVQAEQYRTIVNSEEKATFSAEMHSLSWLRWSAYRARRGAASTDG